MIESEDLRPALHGPGAPYKSRFYPTQIDPARFLPEELGWR